jgi:dipeptidyl-peptidase-4
MVKPLSVTVLFFTFAVFGYGQNKLLTIDDIFSSDPLRRIEFSGNPAEVEWSNDGRSFRRVENGKALRVDPVTGQTIEYFDTLQFVKAAARVGISAADAFGIIDSGGFQFNSSENAILFRSGTNLYHFDFRSMNIRQLTRSPQEIKGPDFSPDGKLVSFVRGNNLFVVDVATGVERQLTRDGREGDKAVYNGYLDWVYEEELYGRGDKRAYWWSPDSTHIAFLRLDESPVPRFVIPNDIPAGQEVEDTNYPKAGDPNPTARLGIADISRNPVSSKTPISSAKFVDLSAYKPEDFLLVRVAWAPDSRTLIFQAQNREQTYLDLDAATLEGKIQKLFRESSPAWVGINDNPFFLKDGTAIWESERDGWNHLYHYGSDGHLIKRLTIGKWEVRKVFGIDPANEWVYFTAIRDDPIAENVYRVRITDGQIERLTKDPGTHSPTFNSTFTYFIDEWSDINTPPQIRLYRNNGTLERVIDENKVEALSQYKLGQPEFLRVKTRDGYEMEAMMIKPPDFDPSKKYPVLIYNYSGPHAPSVINQWGGDFYMWHQMMAEKGYIIWVCDNRTASGKGLESTWPVYKHFGESELRDIEDGITYLKLFPFVDANRIGIWGWSYGGFMTTYALTHSKLFKIGIAGGTVSDWRNYDSIYTERYMLTPEHNKEGYDRSSVQKAAKNLSGRLLLIHGMIDNNVHMQNTTQLIYELQKADKQFDLMIYPTARHVVADPDQVQHWFTLMTDFIVRNL